MPKNKLASGMTTTESDFFLAYINNGKNATRAYAEIKPAVAQSTANVNGSKLLNSTGVQRALTDYYDKLQLKSVQTREYLTTEAHEIGQEARGKGELKTALSAVELKGKLNRVFTDDVPEMEGYSVLMQQLVVNIKASPGPARADEAHATQPGPILDVVGEDNDG